jgi:hypothetical protein
MLNETATLWLTSGTPLDFPGNFLYPGQSDLTEDNRVNAGVYFATLQLNGEKYTRKVVVE